MDGLSALPWTARWCQGTLPCRDDHAALDDQLGIQQVPVALERVAAQEDMSASLPVSSVPS